MGKSLSGTPKKREKVIRYYLQVHSPSMQRIYASSKATTTVHTTYKVHLTSFPISKSKDFYQSSPKTNSSQKAFLPSVRDRYELLKFLYDDSRFWTSFCRFLRFRVYLYLRIYEFVYATFVCLIRLSTTMHDDFLPTSDEILLCSSDLLRLCFDAITFPPPPTIMFWRDVLPPRVFFYRPTVRHRCFFRANSFFRRSISPSVLSTKSAPDMPQNIVDLQ